MGNGVPRGHGIVGSAVKLIHGRRRPWSRIRIRPGRVNLGEFRLAGPERPRLLV